MATTELNPLLDFAGLPRFASIKTEHIMPAVELLLAENRARIEDLTRPGTSATWADFVAPLEDANERLGRVWGLVAHLLSVVDSPAIREAYNANLPKVTQYYTELAQNLAVYEKYKTLAAAPEFAQLSNAQRRFVENELRDFRLGGAELPPEQKQRFGEIQQEISALSAKFSENLLDATNAFVVFVNDETRLSGLPQDVRDAAMEAAQRDGQSGWKLTLQAPCLLPVLKYANDRSLREAFYRANVTRASEFVNLEWDNTPLIDRILKLRAEAATLLGYHNFAEVSLVPKMARSPAEVTAFLHDLAAKVKPYAERDYAELEDYALAKLSLARFESWDIAYASEKLRQERYAFSEEEIKQHFPQPSVLEGLFRIVQAVFSVQIIPDEAEIWHPDVRFLRIENSEGILLGQFYIDLHARETKLDGAWSQGMLTRRIREGRLRTPLAALVCNFAPSVGNNPTLLNHDDVLTLFHETGHVLHHILTQSNENTSTGIAAVEWDFVEFHSLFMENFGWEQSTLRLCMAPEKRVVLSSDVLCQRIIASRKFLAGFDLIKEIAMALTDLRLHMEQIDVYELNMLFRELLHVLANISDSEFNRPLQRLDHVFSGAYAAGMYSYLWSEVFSSDAFRYVKDELNMGGPKIHRLKVEIFERAGTRPAWEAFQRFRGADPLQTALLEARGLGTQVDLP
ncbi:MAG: M3 family metallopeptidase [Betaproteobacteria bacterium]|nr:M3 family metallopeptidase [Betaproteobacteria bacterium]